MKHNYNSQKLRLPIDKFDTSALHNVNESFILENQRELLIWLQDCNWPVARSVVKIVFPYYLKIEDAIIDVLNTEDDEWRTSLIYSIICNQPKVSEKIDEKLFEMLQLSSQSEFVIEAIDTVFNNRNDL